MHLSQPRRPWTTQCLAAVLAPLMLSSLCVAQAVSPAGQGAAPAPASTDEPLPDLATFAAQVKERLRTDRALQANYTFLEKRQEIEIGKLGKVAVGSTKVYEVYPSRDPGDSYKRLISVDGTPVSPRELEKGDAKHRRDLEERESSASARARHERDVAEERRREHEDIEEIFRVYDMKLLGRERWHGYPTIVGALEPRKSYQPKSDDGKAMKRFRAKVWVDELDYQLARVELEATEDVTYGWGVIGRLHKGARISYERTKINDEVWLPARLHIVGTGRSLMFRSFSIDSTTEWSQYKKFGVRTQETYTQ